MAAEQGFAGAEISRIAMLLGDGLAAAQRGDYTSALRIWRPLAEQGNDDAQHALGAIYGLVNGRRGVRRAEDWAKMLEKAGDEIANGRFIVRCVGAERFLDCETVAVLLSLRQNLIGDLKSASGANIMMIDTAVISYYNFIRVQGWIGNLSLVFEREVFGQKPLNEFHGAQVGDRLEEQLQRLAEVMMPLQDRAHRMMMRSLLAIG